MTNNNMYFIANWKMFGKQSSINSINNTIFFSDYFFFSYMSLLYYHLQGSAHTHLLKINIQNCFNEYLIYESTESLVVPAIFVTIDLFSSNK